MPNIVPVEIVDLLCDRMTMKVMVTQDNLYQPHAIVTDHVCASDSGRLLYLEALNESVTDLNLLHSSWLGRKISIALRGIDGSAYEIKSHPLRKHVSGTLFDQYQQIWIRQGVQLCAVWELLPEQIIDHRRQQRQVARENVGSFYANSPSVLRH